MELNLGVYGAKRQSWSESGREILKKILSKNPRVQSIEKLTDLYLDALVGHEDEEAIKKSNILYWVTNNARSLLMQTEEGVARTRKLAAKRKADVAKATAKMKEVVRREATKLLLETVMPNGKELRDCTGKEIRKLGPQWRSVLYGLEKTVPLDMRVGDVYKTNAQLQKLVK